MSEDASISTLLPRPAPAWPASLDNVVWGIDEIHLPNYLLPRDCPRVTYRACPATSDQDRARFFTGASDHVVAIQLDWLKRAADQLLFVYELPFDPFELLDESAGYWISRMPVKPLNVLEVRQPLSAIASRGVDVRIVPDLRQLRDAVARSTVDFSIIRMRDKSTA